MSIGPFITTITLLSGAKHATYSPCCTWMEQINGIEPGQPPQVFSVGLLIGNIFQKHHLPSAIQKVLEESVSVYFRAAPKCLGIAV
jgi:hypothetical protein